MNEFELFTIMYFWIDCYYEKNTNDRINNLISEMNPFLWKDIGSADPAYYDDFCRFIKGKTITLDNSFELAKSFIKTIDYVDITEAFDEPDYDKWQDGCKKYIAEEHKGGESRVI